MRNKSVAHTALAILEHRYTGINMDSFGGKLLDVLVYW